MLPRYGRAEQETKNMGRYYSGDIDGKFWFAVQPSNDPEFFGGCLIEPNSVDYGFTKEDLPAIEQGLDKCVANLNGYRAKLDEFFSAHNGYNDGMLAEALGIAETEVHDLLEWYARLELGRKIHDCVKRTGSCYFEAEL